MPLLRASLVAAPPTPSNFSLATEDFLQRTWDLVEGSVDPESVSRFIFEFASRHPGLLNEFTRTSQHLRWLVTIFANSRFLSEEILRRPEWLLRIEDITPPVAATEYKQHLQKFLEERGATVPTALDLALFRRRELIRIVLRDTLQVASLFEITRELSDLAEVILDSALHAATAETELRYGLPQVGDSSGKDSPAVCTVIALGKLGACELNYSSDVDLMFLYSDNGETSGPQRISNKEFFIKVANQFTNLLSTYTAAGICYRVDLRLRPEGTLGELSISLPAAKEYYSKRARDWELQMLIKARVAAGDETLGKALLDFVEPSIYSTTLDFSTIETMSEARERISEKLARRRLRKNDLDVKLARGGIRDIEFLVQCLQRLHGGRDAWVRHGGTLLALARLHDKDHLSKTECERLSDAYEFLRTVEHRLQMEEDRQTHSLPPGGPELERIARRIPARYLGDPNSVNGSVNPSTRLLQSLNQHLESVQGIYESIVHAQRPLYYGPPLTYTPQMTDFSRPIKEERGTSGVSKELVKLLERSAPQFASRLQRRGVQRCEHALARFLDGLGKHPDWLQFLDEHSKVADAVVQIFEVSPFLSEQLTRKPELLEEIRRGVEESERRWAFEGLAAPLNDIAGLRVFFRREMFRIQTGSICLPEPVFQTLDRTSALVEFAIARAYRIAREQAVAHAQTHATSDKPFYEPQGEMMVVALGRLGMREFDLGSDADLVFIIPDSEAQRQRFWTRVAEHLIEIVTAYADDGSFLSLDTRLRPNGREGTLVQTESAYVDYFSSKAEAWEGIAYMKARGVAGDTDRATKFLTELQQVDWRRYGQSGRSKQDLRQMRLRLQREQGSLTPLKAGDGGYYDADFILMYLRLKGAGLFFKSLNTPERVDIVEKMGHLERADAEFLMEATTYFRAVDHAIRVVTGRAEEKLPKSSVEHAMVTELVQRWAGSDQSRATTLEGELSRLRTKMRRLFDFVFHH